MSKYTLIIADDEEIARKALNLLVKKELPEIEVIALAQNGSELVSLIQAHQPDLAIVDVNMPGLSGIEAIDLLTSRGCTTRFIINTAYEEFEYVQRALALKVDAYLLKPERRENTVATIRRLCAEIDRSRTNYQSQRQVWKLFSNLQPVLESEILYSLFIGEASSDSFHAYCEMHNYTFEVGAVAVLLPVHSSPVTLKGQDKTALRRALGEAFGASCTYLAAITESNICLLIFVQPGDTETQRTWLDDVLHVALDSLNSKLTPALRAGVGGIYSTFDRMVDSYREGLLALGEPSGKTGVTFYQSSSAQDTRQSLVEAARTLILAAWEGNLQRIGAELLRYRDLIQGDRATASELWTQISRVLTAQIPIGSVPPPALHEQLNYTATLLTQRGASSDYTEPIREGLYRIAALLDQTAPQTEESLVERAMQYIDAHYAEDLSLDAIAEQIGVSGGYLSRRISAERGKTFVECLTETRMRAATSLALETRLPIREIALRTGYSNTTYFCRVFKKYTGKTIGDLRSEHRRQS